ARRSPRAALDGAGGRPRCGPSPAGGGAPRATRRNTVHDDFTPSRAGLLARTRSLRRQLARVRGPGVVAEEACGCDARGGYRRFGRSRPGRGPRGEAGRGARGGAVACAPGPPLPGDPAGGERVLALTGAVPPGA